MPRHEPSTSETLADARGHPIRGGLDRAAVAAAGEDLAPHRAPDEGGESGAPAGRGAGGRRIGVFSVGDSGAHDAVGHPAEQLHRAVVARGARPRVARGDAVQTAAELEARAGDAFDRELATAELFEEAGRAQWTVGRDRGPRGGDVEAAVIVAARGQVLAPGLVVAGIDVVAVGELVDLARR